MKFYKRYPGDITIKTGDLTLVEFGAYDRLLDHYYSKEQPIDQERVYIVARCQSASDRQAVDRVLREFWTLTDAGWVQQRADEMIADALPRIEAARANGRKGGRPKKNPAASEEKPTGFSGETQREPEAKTIQIPDCSLSENKVSKASPSHPRRAGEGRFAEFWSAWPAHKRKAGKAQCEAKWRTRGCEAIADRVIAAVEAMRESPDWLKDDGEFIPAPLVWLNQCRWEGVEIAPAKSTESVEQYQARMAAEREADRARATPPPAAVLALVNRAIKPAEVA